MHDLTHDVIHSIHFGCPTSTEVVAEYY